MKLPMIFLTILQVIIIASQSIRWFTYGINYDVLSIIFLSMTVMIFAILENENE